MSTEKKKKRKRRINLLILTLIAILLATVFMFRYTHQAGIGGEKYWVYVENEVCTVIVTEILPNKLRIDIDSLELNGANYTQSIENITFYFYVTQEIELTPEIGFNEETSICQIRIENCSFSRAMITFYELHYSEDMSWRDPLFPIEIRKHFTSFFMQFETFKEEDG